MRIPKYSRHSSGQARVRLNGRVYYLGPYGSKSSKDEYNRLVGEWASGGGVIITGSSASKHVESKPLATNAAVPPPIVRIKSR